MRDYTAARVVGVLGLVAGISLTLRPSQAEPPPAMEPRPIKDIIKALSGKPEQRPALASTRWLAEVEGATKLEVPVGSSLTTLGPWSDNNALLRSEAALSERHCELPTGAKREAVAALWKEFGTALPEVLRGYALASAGKTEEAVQVWQAFAKAEMPDERCQSEHPMYSYRRVSRMSTAIECIQKVSPKTNVDDLKALLNRARSCQENNHAVG